MGRIYKRWKPQLAYTHGFILRRITEEKRASGIMKFIKPERPQVFDYINFTRINFVH